MVFDVVPERARAPFGTPHVQVLTDVTVDKRHEHEGGQAQGENPSEGKMPTPRRGHSASMTMKRSPARICRRASRRQACRPTVAATGVVGVAVIAAAVAVATAAVVVVVATAAAAPAGVAARAAAATATELGEA